MDTIAEFASMTRMSISKHIKHLEQKKFIIVNKPLHYTHGQTNTYSLNIELIMSFSVDKSRIKLLPDIQVAHKSDTRLTQVAYKSQHGHVKDLYATYNEVEETRGKKEERKGARKKRVPLSDSFLPNDRLDNLIAETSAKSGLSPDQLLTKFRNLQRSKEGLSADWDGEYENFLITEKPQHFSTTSGEIKNTLLFYGAGHPDFDRNKAFEEKWLKQQAIRKHDQKLN